MTKVLALTIPERETIIRALDDPPPGLEELRAVLLREHVGRVRTASSIRVRRGDRGGSARASRPLAVSLCSGVSRVLEARPILRP